MIYFSLTSNLFKNRVLGELKSGEEIASLDSEQESARSVRRGRKFRRGFLAGEQVKREIDSLGAFPSSWTNKFRD